MAEAKPLARWTVSELLEARPGAAEVLAAHGVDPRTRCHRAAREGMTLRQVLGHVCPVDDAEATLRDLAELMGD